MAYNPWGGAYSLPVPMPPEPTPPPPQAPPQVPASIAGNPLMVQEWQRLVGAGNDPVAAENAVKQAIGGLGADYNPSGTEQSVLAESGYAGATGAGQWVNQMMDWQKFRDPACPPDRPYHPDPVHMQQAFGINIGDPSGKCVEKPVDVPPGYSANNQAPGQVPGQPAQAQNGQQFDWQGALKDMMAQIQGQQAPRTNPNALAQTMAPVQSSLGGLLGAAGPQKQAAAGVVPQTMGTGWSSTQGGLVNMLKQRQRMPGQQPQAGSWF